LKRSLPGGLVMRSIPVIGEESIKIALRRFGRLR